MKDTTPSNAVGYVLVCLPALRSWQGFFVTTDFDEVAARNIDALRPAFEEPAQSGGRPAAVIHELSGIPEKDQAMVGGLASAICEMYAANQRQTVAPRLAAATEREKLLIDAALYKNSIRLATFAATLRRLMGSDYFLVVGHVEGDGWRTTVERVEAADIAEAREKLFARMPR